ncbi:unnamed protein product [Paramecium sonneborni]|uniref:MORN repeat protein n=1 Tax=Paramecium sonneborni TaxID=65129 RepID=A0A8S1QS11_9CILI|nr:unnamed protein product [Paramecium sonneborni]
MISCHEYCFQHPSCAIVGIYKGKHNQQCQRKLCIECIVTQKIPPDEFLSKEQFSKQLVDKFNKLNLDNQLKSRKSKSILKNVLHQLDILLEEINLIFQSLKDSINGISQYSEARDEKFLSINQNLNPFECSQAELDFLVYFLEGDIFEQWIKKEIQLTPQIQKAVKLLERIVQNGYKTSHLFENIHYNFLDFLQNQNSKGLIEESFELQGLQNINNQLEETTFQFTKQKNGDKVYKKNGEILRIQRSQSGCKDQKILNNLEQIKYLEFIGEHGVNGYKLWDYFWKGIYIGGGIYSIMGLKEGMWIDLCNNYWDGKKVIEEGFYKKDKRIGYWKIEQENKIVGGGYYDEEKSQKIGSWIELNDGFYGGSQVIYKGEYNNGKKVGKWDIIFEQKQIGGGYYKEVEECTLKIGKWIEVSNGFWSLSKVTYHGEYNKNGIKIGEWDIMYEQKSIGGGQYKEVQGYSFKIGRWIELNNEFQFYSQVTHNGTYNNNGKKIGKWSISFNSDTQNQQIGGGAYDDEGGQIKIGSWIELSDRFRDQSHITYNGEYNKKGQKIGKWDIMYKEVGKGKAQSIGGGSYDSEEGQIKVGKWTELDDRFFYRSQITYNGEYNKNGIKIGKWEIKYKEVGKEKPEQIGGGSYDQVQGCTIKIGKWVELNDGFEFYSQVTHNGTYNKNGKKISKWIIYFNSEGKNQQIGGGLYDDRGSQIKIGKWIELSDLFRYQWQVTYNGEYNQKGKKVGKWQEVNIMWGRNEIINEVNYDS